MLISFSLILILLTVPYFGSNLKTESNHIGAIVSYANNATYRNKGRTQEMKVPERNKAGNNKSIVDLMDKIHYTANSTEESQPIRDIKNINMVFGWSFSVKGREKRDYKLTKPEDSPYAVVIYIERAESFVFVSGTLLSLDWALTIDYPFHSTFKSNELPKSMVQIYAGGNDFDEVVERFESQPLPGGSQIRDAHTIHWHNQSGITLLHTYEKFTFSKTVRPIIMTSKKWKPWNYKHCQVTGFGYIDNDGPHPDDLARKTNNLKLRPCECNMWETRNNTADFQVCSSPQSAFDARLASGDDGAGLVCDGQVIAVADFPYTVKNLKSCETEKDYTKTFGSKDSVSRFSLLYPFHDWIFSIIHATDAHANAYAHEDTTQSSTSRVRTSTHATFEIILTVSVLCFSERFFKLG